MARPWLFALLVICSARLAYAAPIADFELFDANGEKVSLADYRGSQLMVVAFLGTECPLVRMYAPRLVELEQEFAKESIAWLGIVPNVQDSPQDVAGFVQDCGLDFPILLDTGCKIADRFSAQRTPEVFVLDQDRVVRYRGRIDDQFDVGLKRRQVDHRHLADAIRELLAGKPVSCTQTEAVGCRIGRPKQPAQDTSVNYAKHIAPILQNRCVTCHRAGEIAPFALTSYDEAAGWADAIVEVVDGGRMPPWFANPAHGTFKNDARMTEAEKELLRTWTANGCPLGDPSDQPKPRAFADGWNIPLPDVVVPMRSTPYHVPATGVISYQHFLADPGFKEDKWVVATEVRPGNHAVVHHVLVYLVGPGEKIVQRLLSGELIGAFAPGSPPRAARPGMAMKIPAGSRILFQMHYTPNGKAQDDMTTLGLKFCDASEVRQPVESGWAVNFTFAIPPHAADYAVNSHYQFPADRLLLQLTPHMHIRGKSFRYEARYPDGRKEILLDVPAFDFNWQIDYLLAEPKLMPKGTVLYCSARYDNSDSNPSNPDPNKRVTFGEQTWDEMMIGWFVCAELPKADQPSSAGR